MQKSARNGAEKATGHEYDVAIVLFCVLTP